MPREIASPAAMAPAPERPPGPILPGNQLERAIGGLLPSAGSVRTSTMRLTFVLFFAIAARTLGASAVPSPMIESKSPAAPAPSATDLQAYATSAEKELRGNILPFWLEHSRDREHGGFIGRIGPDMKVYPEVAHGMLLTSRILWTFSAAYRRFQAPEYIEMAHWAFRDLMDRGWDSHYGGVFWSVTPQGQPAEAAKHIYGQAFAIYSLAEYYRTTHDRAALDRAVALYRLIEQNAHDQKHGGYFEGFSRTWKRDDTVQKRILGSLAPKSQNTHIHVLEAYTNLLRVWPDPGLKENQRALVELLLTRIINPSNHHLVLFFTDDWTPVSDVISFGHDIELSWLIVEAATVLGDPVLLERAKAEAIRIARITNAEGIDRDGGVFNEAEPKGLSDTNKDWWPQAEAAVGFLNAFQITRDPSFYADSHRSWQYIESKFVDRKYGDWYETLTRDGKPRLERSSKQSVWKCPYHNTRCCLELMERIEELEKK